MADAPHAVERPLANGQTRIDFQTDPSRYRHWKLRIDGDVATLLMDVDEKARCSRATSSNSIPTISASTSSWPTRSSACASSIPQVRVVVLRSGKPRVFCAGANIRMLAGASHAHKVNFCKFTNETRNGIEDASENSGPSYICAINGTAAGGGYELALACDHIMLVDDGSSAVSLPELPLLAVLPGTGGLTRVVDKRKVRARPRRLLLHHRGGRERQARGRVAAGRRSRAGFEIRRSGGGAGERVRRRNPGAAPPLAKASGSRR